MKRLIQISDPHVIAPPALVSGRLDTAALLERAVVRISGLLERVGPVSALLVSGDVTDHGDPESYALFRRIVSPLGLPVLAIPGNHDRREPMREAFNDLGYMPGAGRLNRLRDLPGLRLIGLDTLVEGEGGGVLDGATLAFLEEALATAPPGVILIALHHPPFATGMRFMDAIGLRETGPLEGALRRSGRDIRLVCGHVHSIHMAMVGGCMALSAPALCSTFQADFRSDAPAGFMTAPGGVLLHDWEDGGLRSLVVGPDDGDGPFAF